VQRQLLPQVLRRFCPAWLWLFFVCCRAFQGLATATLTWLFDALQDLTLYPFRRIRNKPFPWGDGQSSLFGCGIDKA